MMKIVLIILFSISPLYAQTYLEFNEYWHSVEVQVQSSESIESVLTKHGYDLDEMDWVKITKNMNGIRNKKLPRKIYLPPKISFEEFLEKHQKSQPKLKRAIASTKPYCQSISKSYLQERFGVEGINYLKYFELVTSRKVQLKKGQNYTEIIKNDQYSYGKVSKGVKLFKNANGLKGSHTKKDQVAYLPFCVDSNVERQIASIVSEKKIEKEEISESKYKFSLGLNYGTLAIEQSSAKLDMSFVKLQGGATYKLDSEYTLGVNLIGTKFLSIGYSESDEYTTVSNIYPEVGLFVSKNYEKWSASLAYDLMNYFVLGSSNGAQTLSPKQVHRMSFKPFLPLKYNVGLFAGIGYLKSFGSEDINGFDASTGAVYSFGKENKYKVSGYAYQSNLSTALSDTNDTSSAYGVSFSVGF